MSNGTNAYWHELDHKYYLSVFKRLPIAFERGEGSRLYDVEGNGYLDLLAGIAVNNLGHCHPRVVNAVREQAGQLMHISNFFVSRPQMRLAEKLVERSGLDKIFFTNSGAEAVEGAVKVARKYAGSKGRGPEVISVENCFHGRTLGTIAMGKREKHKAFGPLPSKYVQIERNDLEAVRKAVSGDTAAIIIEPVQGEGGIHVAEKPYLEALRKLCDEQDIALIFDEIQCGMGRIGSLFAWQHFGVKPDIITLAKGLGAGFPVGAFLCTEAINGAMDYGDHGTTFGGNPLACAAALASVETIEEEKLPEMAADTGKWLIGKLEGLKERHASITEIRGLGLMTGIVFDREAKPMVEALLKRKIIANATAGNVLRLVPPLNISREDLSHFLEEFSNAIEDLHE